MKNLQIVRPGLLASLLLGLTAIQAPAADATAEPETIAGTRMRVDWPRLISGNNLELAKLPSSHGDSLRLGNGDIGVAVYAVPECLVLFVGRLSAGCLLGREMFLGIVSSAGWCSCCFCCLRPFYWV